MKRLALLLAPGFEEVEAAAFLAVFGATRRVEGLDAYGVESLALEREVTSAQGWHLRGLGRLADATASGFTAAAIPGGSFEKGFAHVCDEPVLAFARSIDAAGGVLAASTTGACALAAAGLLVGKRATTSPLGEGRHRAYLAECGATLSDGPIERDGTVLTASTTASAIALAFEALRALEGDRAVATVRRLLGAA